MRTMPPYQFVPVDPSAIPATRLKPVWHDKLPQPQTFTGEVLCSGQVLTPLLIGNEQIAWQDLPDSQAKNQVRQCLSGQRIDEDHKVIFPFQFPDGTYGIPGTQIKGMLSQVIGALTSAPIERVNDRTFSFRPNAQFGEENADVPRPALGLLLAKLKDGGWIVLKIDADLRTVRNYFRREDINALLTTLRLTRADYNAWEKSWFQKPSLQPVDAVAWLKKLGTDQIPFESCGGLDGDGQLARRHPQFNITGLKRSLLLPLELLERSANNPKNYLRLPSHLSQLYNLTIQHLGDDREGHLKMHPHVKNDADRRTIKSALQSCRKVLTYPRLIFFEYLGDHPNMQIVSFGLNFRYRWRYRDTIKNVCRWQDGQWQKKIRPLFDLTAETDQELAQATLSPRRRLFGFVKGEREESRPDRLEALAGRLTFSYASHVPGTGRETPPVALKILSSPKPSAVEFYLDQTGRTFAQANVSLRDYGDTGRLTKDTDSVGTPRGRKFYLHQPQAATNSSCYTLSRPQDPQDPGPGSDQSATALTLLAPDGQQGCPTFKFTIRFQNLEPHELGLLLLSLHLGNDPDKLETLKSSGQLRAHKLGHGQPLGLGSFLIRVDKLHILDVNADGAPVLNENSGLPQVCRQALICTFNQWFGFNLPETSDWTALWSKGHLGHLSQVLLFRHPDRQVALSYPYAHLHHKCTIYNYHSTIRNAHLKRRRGSRASLEALPAAPTMWSQPLQLTDCEPE